VVALYAELDEKAEAVRRADQIKSRFLSHMSHGFRTPVNSILGLTQLLLRRAERGRRNNGHDYLANPLTSCPRSRSVFHASMARRIL
jgi:signal transduction histidine kinase